MIQFLYLVLLSEFNLPALAGSHISNTYYAGKSIKRSIAAATVLSESCEKTSRISGVEAARDAWPLQNIHTGHRIVSFHSALMGTASWELGVMLIPFADSGSALTTLSQS